MSENKDVRELNPDKLEQFSGSGMDITHLGSCGVCMHEGMYKTGAQREDPRLSARFRHLNAPAVSLTAPGAGLSSA